MVPDLKRGHSSMEPTRAMRRICPPSHWPTPAKTHAMSGWLGLAWLGLACSQSPARQPLSTMTGWSNIIALYVKICILWLPFDIQGSLSLSHDSPVIARFVPGPPHTLVRGREDVIHPDSSSCLKQNVRNPISPLAQIACQCTPASNVPPCNQSII
jgi:hypothetical protein